MGKQRQAVALALAFAVGCAAPVKMAPPAPPDFSAPEQPAFVSTSTLTIECASSRDIFNQAKKALALAKYNGVLLRAEKAKTSSLTRVVAELRTVAPPEPEPVEHFPAWGWAALVAVAGAAFLAGGAVR